MKKIVWRNSRFVIFEADHTGHFEARLIEALTVVGPENPFGNAAWFETLKEAIAFASESIEREENK